MSPSLQYHIAFEGGRFDGEHGWAKPHVIPPMALYLAESADVEWGVGYYIEPGDGRYEYLRVHKDDVACECIYRASGMDDPVLTQTHEREPVPA